MEDLVAWAKVAGFFFGSDASGVSSRVAKAAGWGWAEAELGWGSWLGWGLGLAEAELDWSFG